MGHRREVFRPTSKKKTKERIQTALTDKNFKLAANIAAYNYSARPIADDFAISLIAAAEAISLGRQLNWKRDAEDLVAAGISIAERKLESKINRQRYPIIFESIVRSIERTRKEESAHE